MNTIPIEVRLSKREIVAVKAAVAPFVAGTVDKTVPKAIL